MGYHKALELQSIYAHSVQPGLEHIRDIDFVFQQASNALENYGCFYICELHPYKQLQGVSARFEHDGNKVSIEYFVHHISDFFTLADKYHLKCVHFREWFDNNDRLAAPRLVSFLFNKQA